MPYQAGDVLLADLDPVAGHEQGGRGLGRPALSGQRV
jgi:mRNA-degrading endonuclease toxin of MazEF toxin-antitoxin module